MAPTSWPGTPETDGCVLSHIPEHALPRLFEERVELTPGLLHTASVAWDAIQAPSPEEVAALAVGSFPELPALSTGLRIHLCELPAIGNGLSLSEEQVRREQNLWITDSMFLHRLRRLSGGETPLAQWSSDGLASRTAVGRRGPCRGA